MTKFEYAIKHIEYCTRSTEFYNNVYLVGGCVRDELLNIHIKDIDIMVDMPNGGIKLANYLLNFHPNSFYDLVIYERFGTAKITFMKDTESECEIEFVAPRTELYDEKSRKPIKVDFCDLKTDALRRDFTVNALYKNIHSNKIIDPTERGLQDLHDMQLNTPTSADIDFFDDPLRMLRAIRFSVQKKFKLSDEIIKACMNNAWRLENISKERIHDEFIKIIMTDDAVIGIKRLHDYNLLKYMTSSDKRFIDDMFGFDQRNEHHHETLDQHVLSVLNGVIKNNKNASLILRLSALLHDVGKTQCYELKEDGIHYRYHGHEIVSGQLAYDILKDLKFSNEICETVKFICERHMLLKQFNDDNGHLKITKKAARKIVRKCGEHIDDILQLMDADNKAHEVESANRLWYQIDEFRALIPTLYVNYSTDKNNSLKCPLNGHDIMKEFNVVPGPKVKELLELATDIFDEDPSYSKDDIIRIMKNKNDNLISTFTSNEDYNNKFIKQITFKK